MKTFLLKGVAGTLLIVFESLGIPRDPYFSSGIPQKHLVIPFPSSPEGPFCSQMILGMILANIHWPFIRESSRFGRISFETHWKFTDSEKGLTSIGTNADEKQKQDYVKIPFEALSGKDSSNVY